MKILSLILVLIPIAACAEPKAIAPPPQPSAIAVSSQPPSLRTTKEGYFAATSRLAFDRAIDAAKIRDSRVFAELEASNEIFLLPAGKTVQFDRCYDGCAVQTFRYPGQAAKFWTVAEALK